MRAVFVRAIITGCLWLPLASRAHGDLHERIDRLTQVIQSQPANARLYVERGDLHRQHTEWTEALADADKAIALEAALAEAQLLRGRVLFESGRFAKAQPALDRYVAQRPEDPEGWLVRARTLARLGKGIGAAHDFTLVIERSDPPTPDHFLERAQALRAAGRTDEATRGLDEGMARLGVIASLQLYAIELERAAGHVDAALKRLDTIAVQFPRREYWFALRGEILADAGRREAARTAFEQGLAALDKVPSARRQTQLTRDTEARLRAGLAQLSTVNLPAPLISSRPQP